MVGNNQELVVGRVGKTVVNETTVTEESSAEASNEEVATENVEETKASTETENNQTEVLKKEVTFKVNEAAYTVDGKRQAMKGAAYIQSPGYLMIPVRYVAEAFGVPENEIIFENGTVSFTYNGTNIKLTKNMNKAVVNGMTVEMDTPLAVKDGRVYAPIGEIAKILGLNKNWNSVEQVAIFTN